MTKPKQSAGAPSFRVLGERVGDHCRRNTKRIGELSEAAFLLKAESLGFRVSKPWGDSERYDFVLDSGPRLWRVQLKCTEALHARGYDVQPIYAVYGKGKVVYSSDDIDVLVAHVVPCEAWYILPVDAFAPSKSLRLYPDIKFPRARWEKYREAWDLLRTREPKTQTADIRAALEASYRPECKGRDWRRCLLHAMGEAMRHKK